MRPYRVVVLSPAVDERLRLLQCAEDFSVQKLVAELSVKGSLYPFSQGLPGSMNSVFTPILPSQALTTLAVNSGPLSERM